MLEYIAQVGDSFVSLAKFFFGDEVHASTLGKFNKVNDHTQEIKPSTKLRIPPKVISHAKTTQEKGKTIFHIEYGFRNCLTDSVGENGKNNYEDVMLVQKRLRELGYPGKDEVGKCGPEIIKAIKFFQIAIANVNDKIKKYQPIIFPDGLISKAGPTEKNLFGQNPSKYEKPDKKTSKPIADDVKNKMDIAIGDEKKLWDKIKSVWETISPYLPDDSNMTSGYRSKDEQQTLLQTWFNMKHKSDIIDEYDEAEWKKYHDMQGKNDAQANIKMCEMIKGATGQLIAVPGSSAHERGHAIDIGGQSDIQQVKMLLWCNCELLNDVTITKILPERNGCLHFEFK